MKLLFFFLLVPSLSYALVCPTTDTTGLGAAVVAGVQNIRCPQGAQRRKVHLTFDDGPMADIRDSSGRVTGGTNGILSALRAQNVKATFFVSTTKIAAGVPNRAALLQTVNSVLDQGHLLANHGHRHDAYDLRMDGEGHVEEAGMSHSTRLEQIRTSQALLNSATNNRYGRQALQWFRFPYGRGVMPSDRELAALERAGTYTFTSTDPAVRRQQYRNQSAALSDLGSSNYSHLKWDNDSQDSVGPRSHKASLTAQEMRDYLVPLLERTCGGGMPQTSVILMHDTKPFNVQAVPIFIEVAKCLGIQFASAADVAAPNATIGSSTLITPRARAVAQVAPGVDVIEQLIRRTATDCPTCHRPEPECRADQCPSDYGNRKCYNNCEAGERSICLYNSEHNGWTNVTPAKLAYCEALFH